MISTTTTPADEARTASPDWSVELRRVGLRVTRQRLAVLTCLQDHPHATADDLLPEVRQALPQITVQSVYMVLNSLNDAGLLRRLDLAGHPARYEPILGAGEDNHHHAVCRRCGRIEDVPCAVGHAPCLTPAADHGMQIQVADVVYQGICAPCAASATQAP